MTTVRWRPMHVTVGIITFCRPDRLRALLLSLDRLTFTGRRPTLDVIIADNDPSGSARYPVEDAAWDIALPVRYVIEPRAGIPFARNRIVTELPPEAEFLAFIDDDEVADPGWLQALLDAGRSYGADVVAGPVLRRFDPGTPDWVTKGTLFHRARYETGTVRDTADTGNVLTHRRVFERFSPPFDESIGQAGGSDREFYRRVSNAGFKIVYANDAIVHERVPADRATAKWVLRRGFHGGNQLALNALTDDASFRQRFQLFASAMWSWIKGALMMLPLSLVQGKRGLLRALWHFHNGAGVMAGLRGSRLHQYGRDGRDERDPADSSTDS